MTTYISQPREIVEEIKVEKENVDGLVLLFGDFGKIVIIFFFGFYTYKNSKKIFQMFISRI